MSATPTLPSGTPLPGPRDGRRSRLLEFDKSPATYVQPWIPLRVCQALPPQQKILLMLRDPVSRAFSGYHQCLSVGQFRPPKLLARHS